MKRIAIFATFAIVAATAVYFAVSNGGEEREKHISGSLVRGRKATGGGDPREAVRTAMKGIDTGGSAAAKRRRATSKPVVNIEMFEHLKGEDRRRAQAVQDALDADDFNKVLKAAEASMKSANPEVRSHAVEALSWFGADALPELTGLMADKDEDVAAEAASAWELALSEIEDCKQRFDIAMAAFATLTNEDALDSIGGLLTNSALELIDDEDDSAKAEENRLAVMQSIVDIIEGGLKGPNPEKAKTLYEDITGNEWISFEEVELYLADPENYATPDERGSETEIPDCVEEADGTENGGEPAAPAAPDAADYPTVQDGAEEPAYPETPEPGETEF